MCRWSRVRMAWAGTGRKGRRGSPFPTQAVLLDHAFFWLPCQPIEKTPCQVVYNNDTMEARIRYAQTPDGRDIETALRMHTSPRATCAYSPPLSPGHRPRSRQNLDDITKRRGVLVRL